MANVTTLTFNADQGASQTYGGVTYTSTGGGNTVMTATGVTSIAFDAFRDNLQLIGVDLGNTVTSINNSAFNSCTALTFVTFQTTSTLETIADFIFYNCLLLPNIIIP